MYFFCFLLFFKFNEFFSVMFCFVFFIIYVFWSCFWIDILLLGDRFFCSGIMKSTETRWTPEEVRCVLDSLHDDVVDLSGMTTDVIGILRGYQQERRKTYLSVIGFSVIITVAVQLVLGGLFG